MYVSMCVCRDKNSDMYCVFGISVQGCFLLNICLYICQLKMVKFI